MRVLIVEDEIIIGMHLAMLVEEFGHEVVGTVRSVAQALTDAVALSPDVAILDIRLPHGSGVDLAGELYARHVLRCIFVSANLDEAVKKALQPCEPIEFVGKPVVPVLLQKVVLL